MKVRILTLLLSALVAGPVTPATAQKKKIDFTALRRQIENEKGRPAQQRIRTLKRLHAVVNPQVRRLLLDLWGDETDTRIRATVLQLLTRHANPAVFAVMRNVLLTTPNNGMRRSAAFGLATQKRPGIQVLVRALRSGNDSLQAAVLPALCGAAPTEKHAARALADALKHLTGRQREQALRALTTVKKTAPLLDSLVELLVDPNHKIRAEALRQLGSAAYKGMKAKLLTIAADESALKPPGMRNATLFALASIPDADTLPVLLGLAMQGNQVVRLAMIQIGRLPKHAARLIRKLHAALDELEGAVERLTAVELLGHFKTPEANQALVKALGDHSTAVVLAAIGPVSRRRLKQGLPRLRKLFEGRHPELRLEAMWAMHGFRKKDSSWPKHLLKLLDSPKIGIRCRAVDLLKDLGYAQALPHVQALCSSQDFQVRSAAYGYLRRVRHKSSVPVLITALEHESGRLEGEVLGTLVALTDRTYPAHEYWKSWWSTAGETFELPRLAKASRKRTGKRKGRGDESEKAARRRGVVTYYGIPILTNRACFVVDVSGSMRQRIGTARSTKLYSVKKALEQVITACSPDLWFNVIPFSDGTRSWVRSLKEASKTNKEEAKAFVRNLVAAGGTNIHDALRRAFDDVGVDTIYLLSDGRPSVGKIIQPRALGDAVRRWNHERRIVIHTISFGHDSELLKQLAKESGGRYVRYI